MSILAGKAYANFLLLIGVVIVGFVIYHLPNDKPVRPEAREPKAAELTRAITNTHWATESVACEFNDKNEVIVNGVVAGSWSALDGTIRIRNNRGWVSYATINGDTLTFDGDELTRVTP